MTFLVEFWYTHLSMPCLTIIRENSLCSRWTNIEARKWAMCWERGFGILSLKWDILIKPHSSGLYRYAIQKWRQKYSKSHRGWMTPRKMCLPDTRLMSIWTHRDGVIIQRAYTASGHGRQGLPPLNKKLLATDTSCKRKICFPPIKSHWVYFVVCLFSGFCLFVLSYCSFAVILWFSANKKYWHPWIF